MELQIFERFGMGRLLCVLQLLLNSIIFINATSFLCRSSYENSDLPNRYRLSDNVIPEHYNIKLEPYFETEGKSFNFSGRCEVNIKIISPTWCISLHAQKPQIKIQNTTVVNTESLNIYKPTKITYNNDTHILTFHFGYEILNGHYLISISFIGRSDNDGIFYRTSYINHGNKGWFVATQFRAVGVRQLFPCWDEPAFKATFNITVRHHEKNLAFSSMPKQHKTFDENIQTTHFKTTRLMSTYLVMFALYDINLTWLIEGDAIYEPLLLQDRMFAKKHIYLAIMSLKNEWKYSENLSYAHHLITPAGPRHNGMGLILYKASNVFYNETLDPVSQKIKAVSVIAYEVARQWFNNLISPSWWSDYWLNEGIARLLGMDIINEMFPGSRMLDLFAVQSKQECLYLDHFISGIMNPLILKVNTSSEIDSLFSFSYYIKAPVILRMLQQFLSDYVFKQGIEIFLDKHKFSSATIDDFWNAMQAAQDVQKTPNIEKFNVKEMMNTWTKQKHYPVLKISNNNRYYLITFIENVNHMSKDDWFIPITMTTITPTKQTYTWRSKLKTHMNHLANQAIELDVSYYQDDLIIVNCLGYYRVNYELENWLKIARYLNSADYKNIHVLDRAQIIDDAFYFLSMRHLNINTFLELTKYLSQETDYVAWYPMIKALEHMSSFFPILDERFNLIKKGMLEILNNVLEQIGYEERSQENYPIKCLRQELAKWACTLKHPKCLQMAKYNLEQHVIEHKKLLPWWREWTYCKGIMTEKNLTGIWKTILQNWTDIQEFDNPNDRILEFLTCIAHPNSIKTYLDDNNLEETVSLKNISLKIRDINSVNRFLFTIIKHAKNDEILEHILNKFKELKPREVNTAAVLIIIINHVYSDSQLEKIRRFVDNNVGQEIIFLNKLLNNMYDTFNIHTLPERDNTFLQLMLDKIAFERMKILINQRMLFIQLKIEKRINEIKLLRHRIEEIVTFE